MRGVGFFPPHTYIWQKRSGPVAYMVTCLSSLNPLFIQMKYWLYHKHKGCHDQAPPWLSALSQPVGLWQEQVLGARIVFEVSQPLHMFWKPVLTIVAQRLMYFKQSIKNLHTHCIFRVVHDHECIMEPGGNYFQWNNLKKYMEKGCIFPKASDIIKSSKAGHFLELMTFFLVLFSWWVFFTTDESP